MTASGVRVSVFGKTDLGLTRDHNEDTFLVADLSTGNASLHPAVREHEVGARGSLFMVADGMGGAAAGEIASAPRTAGTGGSEGGAAGTAVTESTGSGVATGGGGVEGEAQPAARSRSATRAARRSGCMLQGTR